MDKELLFQITKDQLETGLRGYPIGYCTTSFVDPEKGLFYRTHPVRDFKHSAAEEVVYYLHYGKEARGAEFAQFIHSLRSEARLQEETIRFIEALPRTGHPMALLSCALLLLGMLEGKNNYEKDCLQIFAKISHLVAVVINHHAGWGKTPPPDPSKGIIENFTNMLQIPRSEKQHLVHIFRLYFILHLDHGGGNLSTFVGKAVASSKEDMYGALSSAMNALAGPLHGRANQDALEFVEEFHKQLGNHPTEASVEKVIRDKLAKKEIIYGFGHAVLRKEDARAALFYEYVDEHFHDNRLVHLARLIRVVGPKVLSENPKIADPYPNVDAISGVALSASGFHYPEYFTVLFGWSRCFGIASQIVYERLQAREGRGVPIYRPKYLYKAGGSSKMPSNQEDEDQ